jgi:hypothetical protein
VLDDIALLVAFLASDDSAWATGWVTGERICASGAAAITRPTMAEGSGPLFSEIPEKRLRRVKNLVFPET